jgi:hypothetical protein
LIILNALRIVVEALTTHGFGLDEKPDILDRDDYIRNLLDYGFSSFVDFFIALGIFMLIWG